MFEGREWYPAPAAAPEAIEELRAVAPRGTPDRYFSLLSFSNGGEGPLLVHPLNFCLYSAEEAIERLRSDNFGMSEFNDLFIFGSNGGGESLAFDQRKGPPWPIVHVDLIGGLDSANLVAPDFDSFLAMVGLEQAQEG